MSEIKIVKFSSEDFQRITGSNDMIDAARLNQTAGPCYTAIQGKKVLGCGGVRIIGVGEAWSLYSEEAKKKKLTLLKETRAWLEAIMRNHAMQRIWSECPDPPNENFIKHLQFRKLDAYLRG